MLKSCSLFLFLLLWSIFALPQSASAQVSPPSNLNSTQSGSVVKLVWKQSSTPGVTYTVFRDAKDGFTASADNQIASGVNSGSYSDSDVESGGLYHYLVQAVVNGKSSASSNQTKYNSEGRRACQLNGQHLIGLIHQASLD